MEPNFTGMFEAHEAAFRQRRDVTSDRSYGETAQLKGCFAYFPGSGPDGKTCRGCDHSYGTRKTGDAAANSKEAVKKDGTPVLKHGRCKAFTKLGGGSDGHSFSHPSRNQGVLLLQHRFGRVHHYGGTEMSKALTASPSGDFMCFYDQDATKAAEALKITLTKRNGRKMSAVPAHSWNRAKFDLLQQGISVAVEPNRE